MDSSDAGCEAYCAVKPIGKGVPKRTAPTRHAGPLPTLMRLGFSTCNTPISQHVSPLAGKTTNRRAVCREIRMSGCVSRKASMFSRGQSCRGKSQSPVDRIVEEMETEPSKPIDEISPGEVTSHRAVIK